MKLTAEALRTLDAESGAGSRVTKDEFEHDQITIVRDEKEVLFSIIKPETVYRGTVKTGGKKAEQKAILYRGSYKIGIIRPHLVFPKENKKGELRLYMSERGFAPELGSFWYVFKRRSDNKLCLGWADPSEFEALQNGDLLVRVIRLSPANSDDDNSGDSTELAIRIERSILARRGQAKFRKKIRARFNDKCCVTGSTLLDVLEAAHIELVAGKDNHDVRNGLLLRTDIHTLFDLGLVGIHPEKLEIHLRPDLLKTEYAFLESQPLQVPEQISRTINRAGLTQRWNSISWTIQVPITAGKDEPTGDT